MIEEHLTQPETYYGPYICESCGNEYEYASEYGLCDECAFTKEMKRRSLNATNNLAHSDYWKHKSRRATNKLVHRFCYEYSINDAWEWMKKEGNIAKLY
jgi:ribosomal protein L37E